MKIAPVRQAALFGHIIADLRIEEGLTQSELADQLGVTRQYVIDLEQGKTTKAVRVLVEAFERLGYVLVPTKDGRQ